MFHLLNFNNPVAGVNDAGVAMTAVPDGEVYAPNSTSYLLTEPYRLKRATMVGTSALRATLKSASLNLVGERTIYSVNRALEPGASPEFDDYEPVYPRLPLNEQIQVADYNNLGASTEIENVGLTIIPDTWSSQLPQVPNVFVAKATFTLTHTLNGWSGGQALTLSQTLQGGTYAVIGAVLQADDAVFFRLIFNRNRLYNGRKLRPGALVQNAVGNALSSRHGRNVLDMGVWGYFNTIELPACETFGTAADSTACILYLWLAQMSTSVDALNQFVS